MRQRRGSGQAGGRSQTRRSSRVLGRALHKGGLWTGAVRGGPACDVDGMAVLGVMGDGAFGTTGHKDGMHGVPCH